MSNCVLRPSVNSSLLGSSFRIHKKQRPPPLLSVPVKYSNIARSNSAHNNCICKCVYTYIYIYIYMYACVCAYVCMRACVYMRVCVCVRARAFLCAVNSLVTLAMSFQEIRLAELFVDRPNSRNPIILPDILYFARYSRGDKSAARRYLPCAQHTFL
jgi:hypothetical protein